MFEPSRRPRGDGKSQGLTSSLVMLGGGGVNQTSLVSSSLNHEELYCFRNADNVSRLSFFGDLCVVDLFQADLETGPLGNKSWIPCRAWRGWEEAPRNDTRTRSGYSQFMPLYVCSAFCRYPVSGMSAQHPDEHLCLRDRPPPPAPRCRRAKIDEVANCSGICRFPVSGMYVHWLAILLRLLFVWILIHSPRG